MDSATSFIPFTAGHLWAFAITLLVTVILPILFRYSRDKAGCRIGKAIAGLILTDEVVRIFVSVGIYENPLALSLPLHLCGVASLLTAWMLWKRSYQAYEVALFWGLGGSIPAMLTPDLQLGFPHPSFIHFFFSHGLTIFGVMYATFAYKFVPTLRSVGKGIAAALVLMMIVAPVNLALDANYMYLCAKPAQSTLMDHFGPWPWYILVLVLIGIGIFLLCYLPFYLHSRFRKKSHTE